jgi:hypothetical protein
LTAVRSLLLLKLLPSIGVYAPPRERCAWWTRIIG